MTEFTSPGALAIRLLRQDFDAIARTSLDQQAGLLGQSIRAALSSPPGTEPHDHPWRRSGELQESIGHRSDDTGAVVGSASPVALWQEVGTPGMPPRPFLGPTAADSAPGLARAVGEAIAAALRSA